MLSPLPSARSSSSKTGSETTYFSLAQLPKSRSRQRSLQKGKSSWTAESVSTLQIGHLCFIARNFLLNGHQTFSALADRFRVYFFIQRVASSVVHVGILKDSHPIELRGRHEFAKLFKIGLGFAGETHDERSAQRNSWNRRSKALQQSQERISVRTALHARQHAAAGVLQRHVHVFC